MTENNTVNAGSVANPFPVEVATPATTSAPKAAVKKTAKKTSGQPVASAKKTAKKAPAATKTATKKSVKKGASAPAPAKKAAAPSKGEHGVERSKDVRWNDKKVAVFKALKALKATSVSAAKTAKEVADKAGNGLTTTDVRHYCYHAKAAGLTEVTKVEGVAGYSFSLTAKGAAVDPAAELKKQSKGE